MKKGFGKVFLVFLSICLILGLNGCGNKSKTSEQGQTTRVIVDAAGNHVEVPIEVKKIGVLPIPWASVIYCIDNSSERLETIHPSAMQAYKGHFLESMDPEYGNISTTCIGSDFSINMEEAVKIGVEVMIIWDYQTDEAEQLKSLGIAPIMIKNETIDELQESMKIIGQLLGKEERARQFIDSYSETYSFMELKQGNVDVADKPRVLYLRNPQLKIQGNDNFMKKVMELAGADNVASEANNTVTMEEILEWDPEVIFLSNFDEFVPEDLYQNKISGQDWSNVSAVKNKRVYKTPLGIYRWDAPGVETPLMMRWMAQMLQPDIFYDYDFENELTTYYKDYFDYKLSQDNIDLIMSKEANKLSK
ncbi:ABC transporter substrate-binding protein [Sinanaerobacter sp. ZZT-01]|uniref:ABC transporter substrate-binding protein n=1 Tax=Sinanaerobacter sp. ZZT-01 TaxID=3111540 RepID=UPI002D79F2E3|nr:ABC transporter substrate-binding protein [Sinanaerobacter sp. ZZT-01]WRR94705.1 ABC transporter substrate-binding protein [Sinanaerobacter sp. ZZT-01]